MEWFVKAFIRASLIWFTAGITLGVAMGAYPPWSIYRAIHAHMNVAGFITMMIYGVGYQLLPRLFGHQLRSRMLAIMHWWLSNVGLAAMVVGFALRAHGRAPHTMLLGVGGTMFASGAFLFVFNMWRTFDLADKRHRARSTSGEARRGLPTME